MFVAVYKGVIIGGGLICHAGLSTSSVVLVRAIVLARVVLVADGVFNLFLFAIVGVVLVALFTRFASPSQVCRFVASLFAALRRGDSDSVSVMLWIVCACFSGEAVVESEQGLCGKKEK